VKFVDTGFWVALLLTKDSHHREAAALWKQPLGNLLCTNHVLGETWTFLRRRAGHRPAVSFLNAAQKSSRLVLTHVEESLEAEALKWLRRHDEREYSFVDATSFAVMRHRRLTEALAFDGDFAAAGFVELRPVPSSEDG
jgi:predicted nucleic acid-binding protein